MSYVFLVVFCVFFKQNTAYEMRISDWSSDVCSSDLLADGVEFIPGHPIAGTEHSGPEAGFGDLFEQRWCILTPVTGTSAPAVARLRELWEPRGSTVAITEDNHHSKCQAISPHPPTPIPYHNLSPPSQPGGRQTGK